MSSFIYDGDVRRLSKARLVFDGCEVDAENVVIYTYSPVRIVWSMLGHRWEALSRSVAVSQAVHDDYDFMFGLPKIMVDDSPLVVRFDSLTDDEAFRAREDPSLNHYGFVVMVPRFPGAHSGVRLIDERKGPA